MVSNGETPKMPSSMYLLKNAPSTSSREKPQVIWVRSFVPKEKNSALPAIGPAFSAARGTSIMVPIGVSHVGSGLFLDVAYYLFRPLAADLHLLHGGGERDHDLRLRVLARLLELGGRVRDGARPACRSGRG